VLVISSFADRETERLFHRRPTKRLDSRIVRKSLIKLLMLDAAVTLGDLRSPPGNRLEMLKGDRSGQHSIRINDQWRICFVWSDAGAAEVEIVDYH
jgi:proteic killer suppression protein